MIAIKYSPLYVALLLTACASTPSGPDVSSSPGYGKSYDQFNYDDAVCRQYANDQASGVVQGSNDNTVRSGVVGTAIGAVAGGLIGGGRGAAVGAGTGLVVGSAVGANSNRNSNYDAQNRYDMVYADCMRSRGNRVESGYPPPPPPGYRY